MPAVKFFARLDLEKIPRFGMETNYFLARILQVWKCPLFLRYPPVLLFVLRFSEKTVAQLFEARQDPKPDRMLL
jgi:Domain of unknown function (DUF4157)